MNPRKYYLKHLENKIIDTTMCTSRFEIQGKFWDFFTKDFLQKDFFELVESTTMVEFYFCSLTFVAYLNGYKTKHFVLDRLYEVIPAFASPKIEQLNLKQF